ncbi:MAG: hypothetical protein LBQ06_05660, partial [Frankiaceae bacterium]|nr:hypothetical protein [Frankiaceae bacterium]
MTGADAIVDSLIRHGVDTVFGLPGVQMYGLFDALARNRDKIRLINARHEQGVAYMAMGHAYATGRPAVFTVVPGPGVLNTMAAIATAQAVNVPILCLSGEVPSEMIGKGRGALHEIPDQLGTLRTLMKWAKRIEHPTQAPDLVAQAFREMSSDRPGPVALEISPDQLTAVADVIPQDPFPLRPSPPPDTEKIAALAAALNRAEHPVLWTGSGALNAAPQVLALAERLGAPVMANRTGRGVVDDRNPLAHNMASIWSLWQDADVLVGIGTRMDAARFGGFRAGLTTARIDVDPAEGRRLKVDIGITADAAAALDALLPLIEPRDTTEAVAASNGAKQAQREEIQTLAPQVPFVNAIREALPENGILCDEMTQVAYASLISYPAFNPRSYITVGYSGTLGAGFPVALGVKVAQPDRPVISITGDGGFLFAANELATAVHHGINLITVLFNNHAYYNVMRDQRRLYEGRDAGSAIT